MTQDELKLLAVLLEKARNVLPKAHTFTVGLLDGKYELYGERVYIYNGVIESYTLNEDGSITTHTSTSV